jgi:hypothetical protein
MNEPMMNANESASLERGYRRLLAWYPKSFRRENEEEILAVLMACAQDGQTRPSLEAALDLLKGAARMRLRPRPGQPRTVFAAARLMCLAALVELAGVLTMMATTRTVMAVLARSDPAAVSASHARMIANEVVAPVVIAIWLYLAWAISRRRDPARIAVAAFFGLITMSLLLALSAGAPLYTPAVFGLGAAQWFVALISLVLVFTPASNRFFRAAEPVPA